MGVPSLNDLTDDKDVKHNEPTNLFDEIADSPEFEAGRGLGVLHFEVDTEARQLTQVVALNQRRLHVQLWTAPSRTPLLFHEHRIHRLL